MRYVVSTAFVVLLTGPAQPQTAPSTLSAPGDQAVMRMTATGVQIYECRAKDGAPAAWAFREPRADLFVAGQPSGRHYAGPTWEHSDGSRIVGRVVVSEPAPRAEDIPWLRLAVVSHAGTGALSGVTAVQRLATVGGVLVGPCPNVGSLSEVPYTADYVMLRGGAA